MRDVMIDLETLSTRPDAMVIAIGAVAFGPAGLGASFHYTIAPDSAIGHVDPSTVAWWMGQGDEARAVFQLPKGSIAGDARAQQAHLPFVLSEFRHFLSDFGPNLRVWGHGSSFDLPIIESAFRACGHMVPWGHRAGRDTRTILELGGVKVTMPEADKHNALSDAKAQALAVIKAAEVLGRDRLWPRDT